MRSNTFKGFNKVTFFSTIFLVFFVIHHVRWIGSFPLYLAPRCSHVVRARAEPEVPNYARGRRIWNIPSNLFKNSTIFCRVWWVSWETKYCFIWRRQSLCTRFLINDEKRRVLAASSMDGWSRAMKSYWCLIPHIAWERDLYAINSPLSFRFPIESPVRCKVE